MKPSAGKVDGPSTHVHPTLLEPRISGAPLHQFEEKTYEKD